MPTFGMGDLKTEALQMAEPIQVTCVHEALGHICLLSSFVNLQTSVMCVLFITIYGPFIGERVGTVPVPLVSKECLRKL